MSDIRKEMDDYLSREIATLKNLDMDEWERVFECVLRHYENGDTIYTMGNGGSASTASHMVCDFNKGVSSELEKRFNFVCLSDNTSEMMAIANDIGYENVFLYPLENKLKKSDLVIAISGSGNSHNIIKACEYARVLGCDIVGVTGYQGGKLKNIANYHIDIQIDDMQITEDIHLIFNHMMMQVLWKCLMKKEGKDAVYRINQ